MLHLPSTLHARRALPSCSDPMLSSGLWLVTVTAHHHWFVINLAALPKHLVLAKRRLDVASNSSAWIVTAPASPLAGLLYRACGVSMGAATYEAPFPKTTALVTRFPE